MRALVVGDNKVINDQVRSIVCRSGFDCRTSDVVPLDSAATHSVRTRFELIVLLLSPHPHLGMETIREIRNTTRAAILAVGPAYDPKFILSALREGVDEYLDESELEAELEATLVGLKIRRSSLQDSGTIIGILGVSGGIGSSTLAANLAVSLARLRKRSVLCDLRLRVCDQSMLLDLKPTHSIADLCRHSDRMDSSMFEQALVRHRSGAQLLASPGHPTASQQVTPKGIRQALCIARTQFPFIVVDLDTTFDPSQQAAIVLSDVVLVVVRLDMTSLRNARQTLDYLLEMGVKEDQVHIIVSCKGQPKELSTKRAEQALGMTPFHCIPHDPARVNEANNKGMPVILERPRAKVSKSIAQLAIRMDRMLHALSRSPGTSQNMPSNGLRSMVSTLFSDSNNGHSNERIETP